MKTAKKNFGQMAVEYAIANRKYDYDIIIIKDTITSDLDKVKEEFKKYDQSNHIIVIRNITPWCMVNI